MDMEEAFSYFGVSPLESRLYIALLRRGVANGSELARAENLTRASVYSALGNLTEKGLVRVIPGSPQRFEATPHRQLMTTFAKRSAATLEELSRGLERLPEPTSTEHVLNFSERNAFDTDLVARLESARREVYISACRDLSFLEPVLTVLTKRKVRLVGFTFAGKSPTGLCGLKVFPGGELYVRPSVPSTHNASERLMVVVDMNYALSGGFSPDGGFLGIGSANQLFVTIMAEHIHHDIYLAKMERATGRDPVGRSILVRSLHESGT